jgi:Raf kinase inhibitor-like YbhB/YbcL family protein
LRYMKVIIFIIVIVIIIGSFVVAMSNPRDAIEVNENDDITINQDHLMDTLKLTSSVFEHNGKIPSRYTCDGDGVNPKLEIEGVDENAKSLVLIMDDPDAPSGTWDHWVKFNIATTTTKIDEATEPEGVSGVGTGGNKEYFGPCPPDREHRYFFKLFSLGTMLELSEGATKKQVEEAMEEHILQSAELIGLYERNSE